MQNTMFKKEKSEPKKRREETYIAIVLPTVYKSNSFLNHDHAK